MRNLKIGIIIVMFCIFISSYSYAEDKLDYQAVISLGEDMGAIKTNETDSNKLDYVQNYLMRQTLLPGGEDIGMSGVLFGVEEASYQAEFNGITFVWPTVSHNVKSNFGMRLHPILNIMRLHDGIDISIPVDSDIFAVADGTILIAANDSDGWGNYIVIDHGNGVTSLYAHNSQMLVSKGEKVNKGQIIAKSGGAKGAYGSGLSTGPHLHFSIYVNGEPIDPMTAYQSAMSLQNIDKLDSNWQKKLEGTNYWDGLIRKISAEKGVDPVFVKCIMAMESSGIYNAVGDNDTSKDWGLMQVNDKSSEYKLDYFKMIRDPKDDNEAREYAITWGVNVILNKVAAAGDNPTAFNVFWRYNGYTEKGYKYAMTVAPIYQLVSGGKDPMTTLITTK